MSNSSQPAKRGGITFLGALTILFIGLKLTGKIDWSWWLVLAPIYWPFAVIGVIIVLWLLLVGILKGIDNFQRRKWRVR